MERETRASQKPPEELLKRMTPEEKLLGLVFGEYPSVNELTQRTDEDISKSHLEFLSLELHDENFIRRYDSIHTQIDEMLSTLDERERHVIERIYGFSGDEPHSTEELAYEIECSVRTVQRIKNSALKKSPCQGLVL